MTPKVQRPIRVPPNVARAAIARAVVGAQQHMMVGDITLFPHQCDAVRRLRRALHERHVALLADDVGLGKTFVALALAREYPSVHIIVPAALRPMWRRAIERTQSIGVHLHSLQHFSRASTRRVSVAAGALVIIDEAHHLRTAATRRYRTIADMVAGRDLLLLSATPIHNSPADLRSLLALANSASARALSSDVLASVVVRRTDVDTRNNARIDATRNAAMNSAPRASAGSRPRVRHHAPCTVPHDPALLDAILSLPAPLPAHDGAVAGALIRLGLLRAWCSSDAALAHSLRRRLMRGEALRHALAAGRYPTHAELRTWIVGHSEVQLAFPELMVTAHVETGPLLSVLDQHLHAVRALVELQTGRFQADAERAEIVRRITFTHSGTPIIAFSQFAETVRAVGRALTDIAGIGVITGRHARIASGSISRQEALSSFAPNAQGRPPPPAHQRIHLLLSTDLLAEGVNLQDAGVVIHLDLPWTDALRQQRVGRLVRMGSPHATVHVFQIEPPAGAELALRLYHRLRKKAAFARHFVGTTVDTRPRRVRTTKNASVAERATAVRTALESWLPSGASSDSANDCTRVRVACVHAPVRGFLAVVSSDPRGSSVPELDGPPTAILAGTWNIDDSGKTRFVVGRALRRIEQLVNAASSDVALPLRASTWYDVRRVIVRWQHHQQLRAGIGRTDETTTREHTRIRATIAHHLARTSATERVRCRADHLRAMTMIDGARGAGAERALREWAHDARHITSATEFALWLTSWQRFPALHIARQVAASNNKPPYLSAVLILETAESTV